MSRIAGIVNARDSRENSRLLTDMLVAMGLGTSGEIAADSDGPSALGWVGKSLGGAFFSRRAMSRRDEPQIAVVLDGCIYNRAELNGSANGKKSDAELVAELYLQHGFGGTLKKLNGDFAVALYDFRDRTLWLGRDRLGLKPLYYRQGKDPFDCAQDRQFAFASRPRALLTLPGAEAAPNRKFVALFAAAHYRYFDNDPEKSPYEGIAQLPAGAMLHLKGNDARVFRYWDLAEQPDYGESEEDLAAAYRELLFDAVKIRLRRASRPAFTLSGGMDSSSVLISAVSQTGNRQTAFSSVYTDKTYDETDEIRSMLAAAVDSWLSVKIDGPDIFRLVDEMVRLHDEPVATATWLSHYLLCREVRERGFGGLFGGLGGDELNAGEYEYYFFHFADLRAAGKEAELEREVALWAKYHDHPIYRKNLAVMEEGLKCMVDPLIPGRCLPDPRRLKRYYATLDSGYYELKNFLPAMEQPFWSYLKNRAYQDLTRETMPCCLRAEDRQTAAFGLENFLPFLDYRLVEFMFRVPGHLKIRDGITKHLLRRAMKGVLPEETRTRIKKTGWNAPAHLWFAVESREPLNDLIRSRRFRERGVYRVGKVEKILREHYEIVTSGRQQENHMMFLWQLVNLELWFRACVDDVRDGERSRERFSADSVQLQAVAGD
jgi:asparagine synthase (glutamine-hydrolysing)